MSSRPLTMTMAAVCVAVSLVAASTVHIAPIIAGGLVAMVVLAVGARLRMALQNEWDSHKRSLVESGYLVTSHEVTQCDKKDRKFVEKARAAVAVITSSDAATGGWLGDVDFKPDLFWIASSAVQASAMQELVDKLKPSRRASDKQAVADGKQWLDARRKQLDERVKLLDPGPEAVEAVRARAEAFHDIDDINRRMTDEPAGDGGGFGGWLRRLVGRS